MKKWAESTILFMPFVFLLNILYIKLYLIW